MLPFLFAFILAQQPAPPPPQASAPPSLTEVQKLQIQNLAQRIELAQLRARIAESEFNAARQELQAKIATLQVDGYRLDLETMAYVPNPPAPPKKDPQ